MGAGTGLFNTFFKPSKMKVFYENRYWNSVEPKKDYGMENMRVLII